MKISRLLLPSLLVWIALTIIHRLFAGSADVKPGTAKPDSNRDQQSKDDSYRAIDAYIQEQMRRLSIPGASLAIVEGGRIVHQRGFGKARPGGEIPTPQTPFFIGSCTKSFTALAVMQLVEAGKLDLDAPVQKYLPWFRVADPKASARITVRHLLNQTSGLPSMPGLALLGNFDSRPDAAERQVRDLSTLKLTRPVGEKFEYSNLNYNILGLIIETASGESYSEYIQKHIFDPLEMRQSYTSKAEAKENSLATGHRYWFSIPIPSPDLPVPTGSLASGQLICSAEDMAHYLIAHLNGGRYGSADSGTDSGAEDMAHYLNTHLNGGRFGGAAGEVQILSSAGIDELQRGAAEWNEIGLSFGSYGMGWVDQGAGTSRIVSHGGTVPDFGAFMALVPEQKKGIVVLFNANHAMTKIFLDEIGMGAAQRLAGLPPASQVFGIAPWIMRSMLLIPILQVAGVIVTLRHLRRWQADPTARPSGGRMWRQHILLPLIPNLLAAGTLIPVLGKTRGFVRPFMPDFSWIALVCGSFAGVWAVLRSVLVLRAAR